MLITNNIQIKHIQFFRNSIHKQKCFMNKALVDILAWGIIKPFVDPVGTLYNYKLTQLNICLILILVTVTQPKADVVTTRSKGTDKIEWLSMSVNRSPEKSLETTAGENRSNALMTTSYERDVVVGVPMKLSKVVFIILF